MGAHRIKIKNSVGAMIRTKRDLARRATMNPEKCIVTVVTHQPSGKVVGVGITRDAADRLRSRINDGDHCELEDFFISV